MTDIYQDPKFFIPRVGGDNNFKHEKEYIEDTKKILQKDQKRIIEKNKNNYDPYEDYQQQIGVLNKTNDKREDKIIINIDSRHRVKKSSIILGETIQLKTDPLQFTEGSKKIFVQDADHDFNINDRITLSNITTKQITLYHTINNPAIEFKQNSNYVKINGKLNLPEPSTISSKPNYINKTMSVKINGFQGDTNIRIGNININEINTNLQVYTDLSLNAENMETENQFDLNPADQDQFRNPFDQPIFSNQHFYIRLDERYDGLEIPPNEFTMTIQLNEISQIPLNLLNCSIPITPNNLIGFQIITDIEKDGYFFEVNNNALYDINAGGQTVIVRRVENFISSFSKPNFYTIQLPLTISNIIGAEVKGCNFPQPYNITQNNNKLYFSTLNEPNTERIIEIQTGNHTFEKIIELIKTEFDNNKLVKVGIGALSNAVGQTNIILEIVEELKININKTTQEIEFSLFESSIIEEAIFPDESILDILDEQTETGTGQTQIIYPQNNKTKYTKNFSPNLSQYKVAEVKIFIEYPFIDSLEIGDNIILENVINTHGLDNSLNDEFEIIEITTQPILIAGEFREGFYIKIGGNDRLTFNNTYIRAKNYQLTPEGSKTHGGTAIKILRKKPFRMDFSKTDTLGEVLGFRSVGEEFAITNYSETIINSDEYSNDINIDSDQQQIIFRSLPFKPYQYDYFFIVCQELNNSLSTGPVKNYFSKIKLDDNYNINRDIVYYTSIPNYKLYEKPIDELFELTFEFRDPDNNLLEWANLEHSFIIELTYIKEKPKNTEISASTGRNLY